jgi:hypothetical protein
MKYVLFFPLLELTCSSFCSNCGCDEYWNHDFNLKKNVYVDDASHVCSRTRTLAPSVGREPN